MPDSHIHTLNDSDFSDNSLEQTHIKSIFSSCSAHSVLSVPKESQRCCYDYPFHLKGSAVLSVLYRAFLSVPVVLRKIPLFTWPKLWATLKENSNSFTVNSLNPSKCAWDFSTWESCCNMSTINHSVISVIDLSLIII